jgi:hypothetical protein
MKNYLYVFSQSRGGATWRRRGFARNISNKKLKYFAGCDTEVE